MLLHVLPIVPALSAENIAYHANRVMLKLTALIC